MHQLRPSGAQRHRTDHPILIEPSRAERNRDAKIHDVITFTKWATLAVDDPRLQRRARACLRALAAFAGDNVYCWATVRRIGVRMGVCERTARSALRDLERLSLIREFPHTKRTKCWGLQHEAIRTFVTSKLITRLARQGALAEQSAPSGLRGSRRSLAVIVASYYDNQWTTRGELAARLGCSERTITRALNDLETGGYARVWRSKSNAEGVRIKLCRTGQMCRPALDKSAGQDGTNLPPKLRSLETKESETLAKEAPLDAAPPLFDDADEDVPNASHRRENSGQCSQPGEGRVWRLHPRPLSGAREAPSQRLRRLCRGLEWHDERRLWHQLDLDAIADLDRALCTDLASLPRDEALRWSRQVERFTTRMNLEQITAGRAA